jgi:hypothetical protein
MSEEVRIKQKWLRLSASEVTAICSLVVAFIAFAYSVIERREDNFYKEAFIRPALTIYFEQRGFNLMLRNFGLGPAVIKSSALGYRDTCIDSATTDQDAWQTATNSIGQKVADDLLVRIQEKLSPLDDTYKQSTRTYNFLPNGAIISASETYQLVGFQSYITHGHLELTRSPNFLEMFSRLWDEFPPKGTRLFYRVRYSSLTGGYEHMARISAGGMQCP